MIQKIILYTFLIIFPSECIFSQNAYPYTEYSDYRYIRYDKNKIIFPGDSSDFQNLFSKLDTLILKGEKKLKKINFRG